MDLNFNFEIDPDAPGFAAVLIAIVVLISLVLISLSVMTWYVTIASNHTAMVCIGRGVC